MEKDVCPHTDPCAAPCGADSPSGMKTGVVILNYNNWQDSVECVESVLASTVAPTWIILADNASTDDSVARFHQWAAGTAEPMPETGNQHKKLLEVTDSDTPEAPSESLVLLRNARNNGYAAGNNAGIRLLLRWGADAILILNNDTVVDKNAFGAMVKRLFAMRRPGLCGARIQYMGTDMLQCRAGGKTNPWTGLSRLDGHMCPAHEALTPEVVEQRINFIYGAAVMASRNFIEVVGGMDEGYFLYCEEQDWAYSAAGRFDLAYAPDALIYHKEGGSSGFSGRSFNVRSLWRLTRSRVRLTARHVPWALPTVCLSIVFAALRMVWRRIGPSRS